MLNIECAHSIQCTPNRDRDHTEHLAGTQPLHLVHIEVPNLEDRLPVSSWKKQTVEMATYPVQRDLSVVLKRCFGDGSLAVGKTANFLSKGFFFLRKVGRKCSVCFQKLF